MNVAIKSPRKASEADATAPMRSGRRASCMAALAEAIELARCTPGLGGFVFWGFHDHPVPLGVTPDPWVRFGWLDAAGQPKPVYLAAFDALRVPLDCTAVARAAGAPAGWPLLSAIPFPDS